METILTLKILESEHLLWFWEIRHGSVFAVSWLLWTLEHEWDHPVLHFRAVLRPPRPVLGAALLLVTEGSAAVS